MKLENLFQPAWIGSMELRNRIVMAPMGTEYAEEGFVTEQQKNCYAARAKGGVGLIVTEDSP
jgi:2,4-dienoyl-CoA reductase-like NADH-dependent reductase (Old Yellow Enzyme family)